MCRTNPILLKRFNLAPQVDALRPQRFDRPPVASGVPTIAPVLASIDVSSLVSERNLLKTIDQPVHVPNSLIAAAAASFGSCLRPVPDVYATKAKLYACQSVCRSRSGKHFNTSGSTSAA